MDITIEEKEGKRILKFGDKLTIYQVSDIQKGLLGSLSEKLDLELDLSEVEECDTAGIQILLSLMKSASSMKIDLSFENISNAVKGTAIHLGLNPEAPLKIQEV